MKHSEDPRVWAYFNKMGHGIAAENRNRNPLGTMKTIRIINWQDQGFFGEIWDRGGRSAETVPHANLDCPRELFKTESEARKACEARIVLNEAAELIARIGTTGAERTDIIQRAEKWLKTNYPHLGSTSKACEPSDLVATN